MVTSPQYKKTGCIMSLTKKALRLASFSALGAACLAAMGFATASKSINLTADVPILCQVSFEATAGTFGPTGLAELGATREFCNSSSGYLIIARVDGADAGASLRVNGGSPYAFSNGQEFVLADINGPGRGSRSVALDAGSGQGGGSLSLRIEAKISN
jgi:hypothetical protein